MSTAMGHGCIPVRAGSELPDGQLVPDDDPRLVVGDSMEIAATCIFRLAADPEARTRLSAGADAAVRCAGVYQGDQIIGAHLGLIQRLREETATGRTPRPRGPVRPPPAERGGQSVFAVEFTHHTRSGTFLEERDADCFLGEAGPAVFSHLPAWLQR